MILVLASTALKLGKLRLLKATRELPGPFLQKEPGQLPSLRWGWANPRPHSPAPPTPQAVHTLWNKPVCSAPWY